MTFLFLNVLQVSSQIIITNPPDTCGNGKMDANEECDPLIPGSGECCSSECKVITSGTSCANGFGVCGQGTDIFGNPQSGKCLTREEQCNTLSSLSLVVPNLLQPNNSVTMNGPWTVCSSVGPVIRSKITSLVPDYYIRQSKCTLSCLGNVPATNSQTCLDLALFTGVSSNQPDNIPCLNDASFNLDLNQITPNTLPNAIQPGVCQAGQCKVADTCNQVRCNGKGTCVLNPNIYLFAKKNINNPEFNAYTAPAQGTLNISNGDQGSAVQCVCDAGFSGVNCQIAGNVFVNKNGTWYSYSQYSTGVGVSIVATFLATLVMLALAYLVIKRKNAETEKPMYYDAQNRGTFIQEPDSPNGSVDSFSYKVKQSKVENPTSQSSLSGSTIDFPTSVAETRSIARRSISHRSAGHSVSGHSVTRISVSKQSVSLTKQMEEHFNQSLPQENNQELPQANVPIASEILPSDAENIYQVVCKAPYAPRMPDEMALMIGDVVYVQKEFTDGWARGTNQRTSHTGVFPIACTVRK